MNIDWANLDSRISIGISIFAFISSVLFSYLSYRQTQRQMRLQTKVSKKIRAYTPQDLPVEVLSDPDADMGMLAFWVQVDVSNTGLRTFAIEDIGSVKTQASTWDVLDNTYMKRTPRTYSGLNTPIDLPITVEPGQMARFLYKFEIVVDKPAIETIRKQTKKSYMVFADAKGIIDQHPWRLVYGDFGPIMVMINIANTSTVVTVDEFG